MGAGEADGWTLAGAIVSLAFGLVLLAVLRPSEISRSYRIIIVQESDFYKTLTVKSDVIKFNYFTFFNTCLIIFQCGRPHNKFSQETYAAVEPRQLTRSGNER